ncbi:kinase [Actinotalea sp. BY-33]|uniref:Kinase n=1 Tax=Actinotalea soli TaxID=2819234 RepID=A0A939RV75_9CELL|nr:aminoglycoside phosphotransferase family protein [Actinotalea soli]MBO1753444.1 kinase [Actinotalea soli]
MSIQLPAGLLALPDHGATWQPWLDGLPRLLEEVLGDWSLVPDGVPGHGECALAVPVRTEEGEPAVLKLGWPHEESDHEHLALQHWHGQGAVHLLTADPRRGALLLERASTTDLGSIDAVEACAVVGGLYRRLHRPALPQLRALSGVAADWAQRLVALPRDAPVPRRLVEQAASLARTFARADGVDETLVHTDLHYANVLASTREPWLAIDPKPLAGDPAFEVAPLLWNRWAEVVATGEVRWAVQQRFWSAVDAGGLDPDRARDWVVVREVVMVLWCLEAADREGRSLTSADREWITRAVTIAKAVQD